MNIILGKLYSVLVSKLVVILYKARRKIYVAEMDAVKTRWQSLPIVSSIRVAYRILYLAKLACHDADIPHALTHICRQATQEHQHNKNASAPQAA